MGKAAISALALYLTMAVGGVQPVPRTAGAQQAPSGTLTVVVPNFNRENFDRGVTSTVDMAYNGNHQDALIGTARNGELTPERGLAESWKMSPDGKTLTLALRKNVRWHDGQPFTADDVVFSIERYKAKDTACVFCGQIKRSVKGVRVVDPHTVQIELVEPDITFPSVLSSRDGDIRVLTRRNYKPSDDGFELVGTPLGTGPWKFVDFKRGVEARFEANTAYWDPKRIPEFAELRVVPRPDPTTRLSMVRTGEADMAVIDASQIGEVKKAGLRLQSIKATTIPMIVFLGCWQKEMWCHQTPFRKAMVLAVDMEGVVKRLFPEGAGNRYANAQFTERALGFDPSLKPYPYDAAEAQKILKEIGYDGKPVKIWSAPLPTSPETPEIMELVQGYLNAAGFKTELTPIEYGAFRPRIVKSPQTFETTYAAHLHIDVGFTRPMMMQNFAVSWLSHEAGGLIQSYWNLPKAEQIYRRLKQITDLKVLDEEFRKVNRETYPEYAFFPIMARNTLFAGGPRVGDWSPGDNGLAWHLETVKKARQ
jgi:peptide/nickel transport system substrate-binding protein